MSRPARVWPCLQLLQWGLSCPFLIATHLILQELNPSLHLAGVTLGWAGPHRLGRLHLSCRLRALVWTRCRRTTGKVQPVLVSASPVDQRKVGMEGGWSGGVRCRALHLPPATRIPCRTGASRAGPRAVCPCRGFLPPARRWGMEPGHGSGCGERRGRGVPHTA